MTPHLYPEVLALSVIHRLFAVITLINPIHISLLICILELMLNLCLDFYSIHLKDWIEVQDIESQSGGLQSSLLPGSKQLGALWLGQVFGAMERLCCWKRRHMKEWSSMIIKNCLWHFQSMCNKSNSILEF